MTACTSGDRDDAGVDATHGGRAGDVLPASRIDPLVAALPQESVGEAPTTRLADGLLPPTNRWFSGLVFGDEPMPVFPFPISFQLTDDGFAAGQPAPVPSATAIVGPALTDVSVDLGSSDSVVSGYDDVSVTLEHRDGDTVLGHTTIAEGSPTVSYTAATSQTDALSVLGDGTFRAAGDGRATVEVGDATWGVVVTGGTLDVDASSMALDEGGSLVLVSVPAGASSDQAAQVLDAATSPLTGVTTTYGTSGSGDQQQQTTELGYATAAGGDALVVAAPHQGDSGPAAGGTDTGLTYPTVYGTVPLSIGTGLAFSAPTTTASAALDLSGLSDAERASVRDQLDADVSLTQAFPADTYYGGKALYRASMLWQLAVQLDDQEAAADLKERIVDQLDLWTRPDGCESRDQECFVYDPAVGGVVGKAPSFGSEEFNDHYFHYGYFLYAAGVMAADDPSLAEGWQPVMDLLAADIASGSQNGSFPDRRAFDPFWSHSWASGYAPFVDGNNQESSSEAVGAYAGLSLWASATGDEALGAEASWMLSAESQAALAYFVAPDLSDPVFRADTAAGVAGAADSAGATTFDHRVVSLNWGGKRDYGTWFSAEPSAIAGIQLIPLSPTSVDYLTSEAAGGAEQVDAFVAEAAPDGFDGPLADYVLMYSALAGKDAAASALATLAALPDTSIDDGNSRSYAMAWMLAAQARG
ncbi:1,3-beta-glucanase [Frigoribacterium sp. ACAM 257]|uniref:glycosyl hydrolase n=1 Tax=Frigoribacterium sp. ACAM 257 TaxID=2508998 RepID=UPI0011B9603C|nr:glycosyl hydrolase [Frigoribacterium sp. ACAM 257]TWX38519.1 1,3-beta-glucanase [Frigoribacterium sp. ACAM 257]